MVRSLFGIYIVQRKPLEKLASPAVGQLFWALMSAALLEKCYWAVAACCVAGYCGHQRHALGHAALTQALWQQSWP